MWTTKNLWSQRWIETKATIKFQLKKVLCLGVAVGNLDVDEKQLSQNIQMSVDFLASLLKKNWQNVSPSSSIVPFGSFTSLCLVKNNIFWIWTKTVFIWRIYANLGMFYRFKLRCLYLKSSSLSVWSFRKNLKSVYAFGVNFVLCWDLDLLLLCFISKNYIFGLVEHGLLYQEIF